MAQDGNLPFERGSTFKDGFTASTAVPHVAMSIAGNDYPVSDDTNGRAGAKLELLPVINRKGSALALTRCGIRASTLNSNSSFNAVNLGGGPGVAALTTGGHGYIPDDSYTSGQSIAAGDIFYAVRKGSVKMRMSTRGGPVLVQEPLIFTTGGTLRHVGTFAGQRIIVAVAGEAATTANVQKLVHVVQY